MAGKKKEEPKKEEVAVKKTYETLDAALWDLYSDADSMPQDKFNRKYKVIQEMVKLEQARTRATSLPEEGSYFKSTE